VPRPGMVRLHPGIEPLVRAIEDTPRSKCVEMMAGQLKRGVSYRRFLGALFLAGIRNVNPQPPGFKFHCVFVIHSAHQASLDLPAGERLLPLFWALDNFKASQARDVEQGDFKLGPFRGRLPSPEQAPGEFREAMEAWDEPRADRAIVSLVRSRGAHEVIELLWQYGARDYRNIGHKAIFVANSWRTLQTIGWRHAEPAMRSLVLGLLDFGAKERVNGFAYEDQSFLANRELIAAGRKLPGDWTLPGGDPARTRELLAIMRDDDHPAACRATLDMIATGEARAQVAWDAVHLAAGELMMRQPGIYGIHTVTSANAMHTAYQLAQNAQTRLLVLLQAVGWMVQFRRYMAGTKGGLKPVDILAPSQAEATGDHLELIEGILADVGKKPREASSRAAAFARQAQELGQRRWLDDFASAARRLVVAKGTDAHDYKYAIAIFEDLDRVSPVFRPQILATATWHLRGSHLADSKVVSQAAAAIRGL